MLNWNVNDRYQYLEPLNFVDMLNWISEIELFDHWTVCLQSVFRNDIFNIYVKTGFGIK